MFNERCQVCTQSSASLYAIKKDDGTQIYVPQFMELRLGKLIVFEGSEGSGKTTQIQRSQAWLRESGWLAQLQAQAQITHLHVTREPGGTTLGTHLRQILLQSTPESINDRAELLLYAADRAQHIETDLRPHLDQGGLILCDRYVDSTVTYQGYGRGLDLTLIDQLNQIATQGLVSDLTLWLDVPPEIGLARAKRRGSHDRMEQTELAFHHRVRQGFEALAAQAPHRIQRIDANLPEFAVAQAIQAVLTEKFEQWFRPLSAA